MGTSTKKCQNTTPLRKSSTLSPDNSNTAAILVLVLSETVLVLELTPLNEPVFGHRGKLTQIRPFAKKTGQNGCSITIALGDFMIGAKRCADKKMQNCDGHLLHSHFFALTFFCH